MVDAAYDADLDVELEEVIHREDVVALRARATGMEMVVPDLSLGMDEVGYRREVETTIRRSQDDPNLVAGQEITEKVVARTTLLVYLVMLLAMSLLEALLIAFLTTRDSPMPHQWHSSVCVGGDF